MQKSLWPGWDVVRVIGSGSFGTVYEIERSVFQKTEKAALKVIQIPGDPRDIEELYNDGYDNESITRRFRSYLEDIVNEYSLMAEMKGHTNVVYCDDLRYVQNEDGIGWTIYIKMELLTPLRQWLNHVAPEQIACKLGMDLCQALKLCKSRNIVHRDIKPQNIFVSKDGDYKLGDFGIAKTSEKTASGTKIGTYKYMAPEVYNNQPYGAGADLYSLGLVMYWLLNERRTPFLPLSAEAPTPSMEEESRRRRFDGEPLPPPAHGSPALKQIVLKACAFEPSARYASAEEMLQELAAVALENAPTPQPEAPLDIELRAEPNAEESGIGSSDTMSAYADHLANEKNGTIDNFYNRHDAPPEDSAEKAAEIPMEHQPDELHQGSAEKQPAEQKPSNSEQRAAPQPQPERVSCANVGQVSAGTEAAERQCDKWTALLLCLFLGWFGAHKIYEGKIGMAVLYLFTFGLFGIGCLVDLISTLRKPKQYPAQKKSAAGTGTASRSGWKR